MTIREYENVSLFNNDSIMNCRASKLCMESLGSECTKLKQKYEACFYKWYSDKYLTGKSKEDECAPLFKEYRECLEVQNN